MLVARSVTERYRLAWQKELRVMNEMVRGAAEDHSHLPQNYWEAEHDARLRYHLALKLQDALEEPV
jgi:hypothetical protein